jgi:hypothetical protein
MLVYALFIYLWLGFFLVKRNVEKVAYIFFCQKTLFNPWRSAGQIVSLAYLVKLVGAYAMILF